MRLCTITTEKIAPSFAVELKKKVLRVGEAMKVFAFSEADCQLVTSALTYFENLPKSEKVLRTLLQRISQEPKRLARPGADGEPILLNQSDVVYTPPIQRPGKIFCIGLNYRDHCEEQNKPIPKKPLLFSKFHTSLVGHQQDVPLPFKLDKCLDYEAEMAFVIGKKARRVTKRTAMKHVAGYTLVNDVSARTVQSTEKQWARAKGFDNSCPMGPVIVTADEITDPHNLAITMHVNGHLRQKSNTNQLIFRIEELIAFITQAITLEPGDIISTGTPGGVGVYSDPQVFLKEGDEMKVTIERLGTLVNHCVKG